MSLLIAPLETLTDRRLSDQERRVIQALYTFMGEDSNTVWPDREALSELTGIQDQNRVSKITTALAKKGWLTKKKKGFGGKINYSLIVPILASDTSYVTGTENQPKTGTIDQQKLVTDASLTEENKKPLIAFKRLKKETKEIYKENKEKSKKPRFKIPTLDEIVAYARQRNSASDPEKFFDYFEAIGWVVGKARKPMRSWPAAYRTWESNDKSWNKPKPAAHSIEVAGDHMRGNCFLSEDVRW